MTMAELDDLAAEVAVAACLVVAVNQLFTDFGETSCSGQADDAERGYVAGVHAVLDGLERRIGRAVADALATKEKTP